MDGKQSRRQLRGAVNRADGPGVVAELQASGMPDDALQLAGDGLAAALLQGVEPAREIAERCIRELLARGWDGDEELAAELLAILESKSSPELQPLGVGLEDLSMVLEGDPDLGGGRIDLRTGEVWPDLDQSLTFGLEDDDADRDADPDRWLPVPCSGSRDGYRDMVAFIGTVTDPERAAQLERSIRGRGAFRRFRGAVGQWPDELERWQAYAEDRQRGRARQWLAEAGYKPSVPSRLPPLPSD